MSPPMKARQHEAKERGRALETWVNSRRTLVGWRDFLEWEIGGVSRLMCVVDHLALHDARESLIGSIRDALGAGWVPRYQATVRKEDESKRQERPIPHGSTVSDDNL